MATIRFNYKCGQIIDNGDELIVTLDATDALEGELVADDLELFVATSSRNLFEVGRSYYLDLTPGEVTK